MLSPYEGLEPGITVYCTVNPPGILPYKRPYEGQAVYRCAVSLVGLVGKSCREVHKSACWFHVCLLKAWYK